MGNALRLSGDVELVALKRKMGVGTVEPARLPDLPAGTKYPPMPKVAKPRKYHNEPVEIAGERFDSKGEAERFLELKMLERGGKVSRLRRQVSFGLTVKGQLIGTYVADFVFLDHATMQTVVEDWKPGVRTDLYLHKKRHLLAEHGIEIFETGRA